jgi:ribulose-5-phosphate 4-epimerase/fuculose-1-phosphate aldolase
MRRLMFLLVGVGVSWLAPSALLQAQSEQPPRSASSLKEEVVVATRVLFDSGFLDTAGHVSVRLDSNRFLMPWRRAPELIVADDVMEYDLDGKAADARGRALVLERFIHAEIYRARPDVTAVVHGHTPSLLLFSSSNIPLRPLFAGAGFIGDQVPAFKNGDAGGGVNNAELGRGLAQTLGKGNAVLMRGHGVVVVAPSAVVLIQRAMNLDVNAQLVARLLAMGDREPMYIKPNPNAGGGGGGDNAREWEAYKRRAETLMKR